ncbi:hypothetical protein F5887DRAFT_173454 [Amanita rubescens]|nr:hypothetical protein F5887DRAFT_173454 [Amanita rubescens]
MSNSLRSDDLPPLYTVDLSLPPHLRYVKLCSDYKTKLIGLSVLYDETVQFLGVSWVARVLLTWGKKLLLRRLYSKDETEEIQAIARNVGIEMYLAVAYNTLLDLFSGCMSAGVMLRGSEREQERMIHLRGLDWEMDPLRELIVRVEYVRDGKVVARGVTYAGYTGVLTGVREGLSISFNYRASLISTSSLIHHRIHQLLMLMGFRRSVPSHLRGILLSPGPPQTLTDLIQWATHPKTRLSSCYLTFCSPTSVLVIERDLASATHHTSDDFLVCANHDQDMEHLSERELVQLLHKHGISGGAAEAIITDSVTRKKCIMRKRISTRRNRRSLSEFKEWLKEEPVKNECTHFSCIMDPSEEGGGLVWVQRYLQIGQ